MTGKLAFIRFDSMRIVLFCLIPEFIRCSRFNEQKMIRGDCVSSILIKSKPTAAKTDKQQRLRM